MKAKVKAAKRRSPRKGRGVQPASESKPKATESWCRSDLPLQLQVELHDRIEQAKRGEGLEDFDDAIVDADRRSDQMLSIVSRDLSRDSE